MTSNTGFLQNTVFCWRVALMGLPWDYRVKCICILYAGGGEKFSFPDTFVLFCYIPMNAVVTRNFVTGSFLRSLMIDSQGYKEPRVYRTISHLTCRYSDGKEPRNGEWPGWDLLVNRLAEQLFLSGLAVYVGDRSLSTRISGRTNEPRQGILWSRHWPISVLAIKSHAFQWMEVDRWTEGSAGAHQTPCLVTYLSSHLSEGNRLPLI